MSLLNEALRKKNTRNDEKVKINLLRTHKYKGKSKKKRVYLIFASVFLCINTFLIWFLFLGQKKPIININKSASKSMIPVKVIQRKTVTKETKKSNNKESNPNSKFQVSKDSIKKITPEKTDDSKPGKLEKGEIKKIKKPNMVKRSIKKKEAGELGEHHEKRIEEVFLKKAIEYHRRNHLDKAIKMYKEVLKKDPVRYEALYNLSSIYLKFSKYSQACLLLNKLKDKNKDSRVLLNLAVAEIGMGRYNEAIKHLMEAEKLKDPPLFDIYLHHAIALSRLNKLDEAMGYYKKAEKLNPDDPVLLFNMAVALDKSEKYIRAMKYYIKFLNNASDQSSDTVRDVKKRIYLLKRYINVSNNP